MSDGLGAAFAAITLFAVLLGLAVLLALVGVVAVVTRRRRDRVPAAVRYAAAVLLVPVGVVPGLAAVALLDEAPAFVPLFLVLVHVPLALAAARARVADAAWLDAAATAALAWAVPFGLATGLTLLASATRLLVPASTTLLAGAVAVVGTLLAGEAVAPVLQAEDTPT